MTIFSKPVYVTTSWVDKGNNLEPSVLYWTIWWHWNSFYLFPRHGNDKHLSVKNDFVINKRWQQKRLSSAKQYPQWIQRAPKWSLFLDRGYHCSKWRTRNYLHIPIYISENGDGICAGQQLCVVFVRWASPLFGILTRGGFFH